MSSANPDDARPTEVARLFFQSMGFMDYRRSWQCLSNESQQRWLAEMRSYFLAKGTDYSIDELRYLIDTNEQGHRNLMFDTFFSKLTMKMGVKASSFKTAEISYVKGDSSNATIKLIVEKKQQTFKMVRENGQWKIIYY